METAEAGAWLHCLVGHRAGGVDSGCAFDVRVPFCGRPLSCRRVLKGNGGAQCGGVYLEMQGHAGGLAGACLACAQLPAACNPIERAVSQHSLQDWLVLMRMPERRYPQMDNREVTHVVTKIDKRLHIHGDFLVSALEHANHNEAFKQYLT